MHLNEILELILKLCEMQAGNRTPPQENGKWMRKHTHTHTSFTDRESLGEMTAGR